MTATAANMQVRTIKAQLDTAKRDAKAIADQWNGKEHQITKEAHEALTAKLGDVDRLETIYKSFKRIDEDPDLLEETRERPVMLGAAADMREGAPNEGYARVDVKSFRELKTQNVFGQEQTIRYYVPIDVGDTEKKSAMYRDMYHVYLRKGFAEVMDRYPRDAKALSAGTDSAGGFLIPEDYQASLIRKIAIQPSIRSLANVITTSRDKVTLPRIRYSTDDKYTSPVRIKWVAENPTANSHRVSDQVFGQIEANVFTAMASQLISIDLIEDAAFDIVNTSLDLFSEAFALGENQVFLTGTGAGQPLGMMNQIAASGEDKIAWVLSGTADDITTSGDAHSGKRLLDLYYALPAQYRSNAVWVMNSNTLRDIDNLVDAQKRPIIQALTNAAITTGEPSVIKGKRIYVDEMMPDKNDATYKFPILFADFKGYTIIDRVAMSIMRVDQPYLENNQIALLARRRLGAQMTQYWRMRALKSNNS